MKLMKTTAVLTLGLLICAFALAAETPIWPENPDEV